jgi:hypothetical protein
VSERRFEYGMNSLRSRLRVFYPDADEQDLWLESPHPLLGGDAPYDRIDRGDWESVLALIEQLESGAVV